MDELEDDDLTDSTPRVVPAYASDEARDLGDELARLYHSRDVDPSDDVVSAIAKLRAKLRKGPRLHPGEFLCDGRYRLIDRLKRGGVDGFWQAWDRADARYVYARVFHGEWVSDDSEVQAFLERGKALSALEHPHIGHVLAADRSDDGFLYLITELFASGNLEEAGALDTVTALQIVAECSAALHHAHAQGLVHGDLVPSNVMLSPDGAAHVVGFRVTPSSNADLTSLYRAPETTERGYEPAPPSDVYALGMTAMRAVSGGELPIWVLRDPGRFIGGLDVPETVKEVLRRSVEWDLDARYADPQALLDELLADPELVEALAVRARERGRFAVSAGHFETLLKIQPERAVEVHTILGDVYTALGSYDDAFTHLLSALERTDDVESLFAPLRTVADRTNDWERLAEALWTQARARDPGRRVILRIELARINQHELQNPQAAADTWAEVLEDHRTSVQAGTALRALQGLARDRGDWQAFVDHGKELLAYTPDDEQARVEYAIGRAYLEHLEAESEGLHFIDRAEAKGWSEVDLGPHLQKIRARHGQWQRVIQLMAQQAETQEISEASPTLLRAGIIASSVHLEEEAFKVYHALLERAPRHVVALRHLARLHHRAHEHDKALQFYERLWETYRGKPAEEPEASERAADCTAYALLLLRRGRGGEAAIRLDEALRLNPNHVPSLQLAGPLMLSRGETSSAGTVFERLMSLFKSVELSPQKIEACLGMGDLCWVQGRLTAAMGWYNRSIELDPFSVTGWWGLSKVAMAARGGHPGADRAPWVMAVPKRYTSNEGLARMLGGALDRDAMRSWLQRSALGQALLDGGDSPMRMACSVVDVMLRNEVISPDLFRRLSETRPAWADPIDDVQRLWFAGGASTFPVARSYTWAERYMDSEFDTDKVRAVLPPELSATPAALDDLRTTEAWETLLGGAAPSAPPPFAVVEPAADDGPPIYDGPVGALVRDGALWLSLSNEQLEVFIARGPSGELEATSDADQAVARLGRQGGRVYISAIGDTALQVDEEDRTQWRLVGGERVTLSGTRLRYQAHLDGVEMPPEPATDRVARSVAPVADISDLPEDEGEDDEVVMTANVTAAAAAAVAAVAAVASDVEGITGAKPDPGPQDAIPEPTVALPDAEPVPEPELEAEATPEVEPEPEPEPEPEAEAEAEEPAAEPTMPLPEPDSAEAEAPAESTLPLEEGEPPLPEPTVALPEAAQPEEVPADAAGDEAGVWDVPVVLDRRALSAPPPPSQLHESNVSAEVMVEPSEEVPRPDADGWEVEAEAPGGTWTERPPGQTPAPAEAIQDAPQWLKQALAAEEGAPGEAAAAEEAPDADEAEADQVPTVLSAVIDPSMLRTDEPPIRDDDSDEVSGFGFPEDVQDEDVDALEPDAPKQVMGVSGPTMVPVERSNTPAPPPRQDRSETSLFMPAMGASDEAAPSAPPAFLEFLSGAERGNTVKIGAELTVGQSRQCGLSIPGDTRLSPTHCVVLATDDGTYVLRDEGSVNGTVVNSKRVEEVTLQGGEVIMVGRTVLRFRLEGNP